MRIEAMRQALEALDSDNPDIQLRAATALRTAIEQAEKPVECMCGICKLGKRDWSLLEATQESLREHMAEIKRLKQRQWVGLTDEDWKQLWDEFDSLDIENDFQDHMVGKYGEGHYIDVDMYWQFQQQMIKQMVNAKLEEKNSG